ncbi:MAG: DUF1538 family protein, partial [Clostridia bacterium]|nr:DUF1538 family protein [Clostridia bacterium]
MASIRSDKHSADDSFGLVALCSIGPILSVLILSILYEPTAETTETVIADIITTQDAILQFVAELPKYAEEVLIAFFPIVGVFLVFQLISHRYKKTQLLRMASGFLYTYIGLVLFLTGAKVGFMPAGSLIGEEIALSPFRYLLIPVGMFMGYFIVAAEPAVAVLKKQVEEISNGRISQKSIGLGLSVGVIINNASFVYDKDYENTEHADERFRHLKPATRKEAYNADITYGTNNEFGFDYLRDNMVTYKENLVQRELNFAI